jgi:hypothetical protein
MHGRGYPALSKRAKRLSGSLAGQDAWLRQGRPRWFGPNPLRTATVGDGEWRGCLRELASATPLPRATDSAAGLQSAGKLSRGDDATCQRGTRHALRQRQAALGDVPHRDVADRSRSIRLPARPRDEQPKATSVDQCPVENRTEQLARRSRWPVASGASMRSARDEGTGTAADGELGCMGQAR